MGHYHVEIGLPLVSLKFFPILFIAPTYTIEKLCTKIPHLLGASVNRKFKPEFSNEGVRGPGGIGTAGGSGTLTAGGGGGSNGSEQQQQVSLIEIFFISLLI